MNNILSKKEREERKMKKHLSWNKIRTQCYEIIRSSQNEKWRPDLVVGIVRGGAIPATFISHYLSVPMETLKISLRDSQEIEVNLDLISQACGCAKEGKVVVNKQKRNILVIDDINDSGATLNTLKETWEKKSSTYFNLNKEDWNNIWSKNVKFATLVSNVHSTFKVDYFGFEINKLQKNVWIVFPWEEWW